MLIELQVLNLICDSPFKNFPKVCKLVLSLHTFFSFWEAGDAWEQFIFHEREVHAMQPLFLSNY